MFADSFSSPAGRPDGIPHGTPDDYHFELDATAFPTEPTAAELIAAWEDTPADDFHVAADAVLSPTASPFAAIREAIRHGLEGAELAQAYALAAPDRPHEALAPKPAAAPEAPAEAGDAYHGPEAYWDEPDPDAGPDLDAQALLWKATRTRIFAWIPPEVDEDRELTQTERRVLSTLFRHLDARLRGTADGNLITDLKHAEIAARLGLPRTKIPVAMGGLERKGWLVRTGRGGNSQACEYRLQIPARLLPGSVPETGTLGAGTEVGSVPETGTSSVPESGTLHVPETGTRTINSEGLQKKSERALQPPARKSSSVRTGKPASPPRTPINEDFWPDEPTRAFCREKLPGLANDTYLSILEGFISHHQAKGSRLADWNAGFRAWVIREVGFRERKNGSNVVRRAQIAEGHRARAEGLQ